MSRGRRSPPDITGMTSVKVNNLAFRTTPEDLRRNFEKFGEIGDVHIPLDMSSKENRGFAFVRFYDRRDAEDAVEAMDESRLDGKVIRVQMALYGRSNTSYKHKISDHNEGHHHKREALGPDVNHESEEDMDTTSV